MIVNNQSESGGLRKTSRRQFVAAAGVAAAAAWAGPRSLQGGQSGIVETIQKAANGDITSIPLRGNIHVLMGSGGNIAVLPGDDGLLLIDAGIAVSHRKIAAALQSISPDPVKHLVNTHWHFDHTDGNDWLHAAGATIIAHENTRKRLSVRHRVEGWRFTFPAVAKTALPVINFKKNLVLILNGKTIKLDYYEPAHTDSDISVHFPDVDVIHVADTWWNGIYPFIDYSSGGSIDGSIAAVESNLARVTDKTIIIPGHGAIGTKSEMQEFRDMLVACREKVAALKEQGRTLEETIAAKPTSAFDAKWGQFVIGPALFTELVYQGV